jgi:vanillate/3-O-methylgallate O-demethylase
MEMPRDRRGFMYADKVMGRGKLVEVATSRGYRCYFRQVPSLCVIDVDWSAPGTKGTVIGGEPGEPQKEIRAVVAQAPYK